MNTMKNKSRRLYVLLLCGLIGLCGGCDSYLDRQTDDALTLEDIFSKRNTTESYLYHVLSFMPNSWNPGASDNEYGEPWWPLCDEGIFSYNRSYRTINNGSMNPSNVGYERWARYYKGIREANIFIANVGNCMELTPSERLLYQNEARFCRAYYYFLLMRQYGPVILVGDEIIPHENVRYDVPRNTWDVCVDYVERELTQLASLLPPEPIKDDWYGKPTSGAALGVKTLLLLFNASPLFNPTDPANYIYKDVKNLDGTPLFPQSYDPEKWKKVIETAREIINSNVYSLVTDSDPYTALRKIYYERWNPEIIWGRSVDIGSWMYGCTPRQFNGYGGHGLTQNHVDAYGMATTGRYPITGYGADGEPVIDPASGYSEGSFVQFAHPVDGVSYEMNSMYVNRDPRFYMNVVWPAMMMTYSNNPASAQEVTFYYNSGSGPGKSHDYAPAGYLNRKITRKDNNPAEYAWGDNRLTWPYIRLAEIYLIYAEALNEYDPGNADILKYLDMVRERAGMKPLEEAYSAAEVADQGFMREMIKRERQIELAMENGQRYFDIRRWMDAGSLNNTIYGMNVFARSQKQDSNFWTRIVIEERVFEAKNYLYPISQEELNRNALLVQNYGW